MYMQIGTYVEKNQTELKQKDWSNISTAKLVITPSRGQKKMSLK